jgi:prepilin-type N-terminal cleavage/methylation domain-containing protein
MMRHPRSRPGFTLVEVIAAIAISTVLIAAVYVTLGLMLNSVRAGKEAIASLQIVRGTAVRLKTDIRQSLGLLATAPAVQNVLNPPPSGGAAGAGGAGGGAGAASSSDPQPYQFNLGLQGDESQMTIYASRLPSYNPADADTPNSPTVFSDLRTINYTVTGDGLVRQEVINVLCTSDPTTDTATTTEVIAPEVTAIHFQYFDPIAQAWQTQWDGTTNGAPAAVEVILTIQMPDQPGIPSQPPFQHRLVIAIPTFGSVAMGQGQ